MKIHPEMSCAVCARKLNHREYPDGSEEWRHNLSEEADHVVVPVPEDQVQTIYTCDFCYETPAEYVLPVDPFESDMIDQDGEVAIRTGSAGDWAVCWPCAALVESNQWTALLRRVTRSWKARRGESISTEARIYLWGYFGKVRQHITGHVHER